MFKDIYKSNVVTRSWPAYKQWYITELNVPPLYGIAFDGVYDELTDPVNSNGISKGGLYHSIKQLYYLSPDTGSILLDSGFRQNYSSTDERNIGSTIAVIALPQSIYGNGIRRNSIELKYDSITLVDDGYSNLISGSEIYGNVFYGSGTIVLTRDVVDDTTLGDYELQYNSSTVINETEVLLNIEPNQFNISQNPTAISGSEILYDGIVSSLSPNISGGFFDVYRYQELDPTGSYLEPYITTIGIYDSDYQMVAVAKLGTPIKKSYGVPLNFLLRFDT